jgi:hypothetical protein
MIQYVTNERLVIWAKDFTDSTTGSQNNFWIIIQKEDDDLDDHSRDY